MRLLRTAAFASTLLLTTAMGWAQTYNVDPVHSAVIFKVNHLNASNFYGRFNKVAGAAQIDAGTLKSLEVSVDAESIDTNNKQRDEHLRGPDFFNTKDFPDITFKSKEVKLLEHADGKTYEVAGDMTFHGTTKPVTIKLAKTGEGKSVQQKDVVGYETTFTIKRSDFGVSGYVGKGVGDDVTLIISFECIKQ